VVIGEIKKFQGIVIPKDAKSFVFGDQVFIPLIRKHSTFKEHGVDLAFKLPF
jgi:hypothetical protein